MNVHTGECQLFISYPDCVQMHQYTSSQVPRPLSENPLKLINLSCSGLVVTNTPQHSVSPVMWLKPKPYSLCDVGKANRSGEKNEALMSSSRSTCLAMFSYSTVQQVFIDMLHFLPTLCFKHAGRDCPSQFIPLIMSDAEESTFSRHHDIARSRLAIASSPTDVQKCKWENMQKTYLLTGIIGGRPTVSMLAAKVVSSS